MTHVKTCFGREAQLFRMHAPSSPLNSSSQLAKKTGNEVSLWQQKLCVTPTHTTPCCSQL